ncbi:MAG: UDP-2,3-diacylglucosamine diphosphatase [Gammaproteobacteria bacterium]|nr:MAG: UDP-2,3-diacylglucosamine diphosphatase [Gammaproteobacteria bacterium]
MSTLFISDLHLDASRPAIIGEFANLIATQAVHADALYILGDLFEAWIGDDADDAVGHRFINAMQPMRSARKPVFFIHGNRDFLIGEGFARKAGLVLLPDACVIDLYGTPTLLMHGDTLCIDDAPYQTFRTLCRSADWQRQFLSRSIVEREAFAKHARQESQSYTRSASNAGIMDVNQSAVIDAMRSAGVRHLIHGHTHRPAVHALEIDGSSAQRIVLADWYETSSVLHVDETKAQGVSLAPNA